VVCRLDSSYAVVEFAEEEAAAVVISQASHNRVQTPSGKQTSLWCQWAVVVPKNQVTPSNNQATTQVTTPVKSESKDLSSLLSSSNLSSALTALTNFASQIQKSQTEQPAQTKPEAQQGNFSQIQQSPIQQRPNQFPNHVQTQQFRNQPTQTQPNPLRSQAPNWDQGFQATTHSKPLGMNPADAQELNTPHQSRPYRTNAPRKSV